MSPNVQPAHASNVNIDIEGTGGRAFLTREICSATFFSHSPVPQNGVLGVVKGCRCPAGGTAEGSRLSAPQGCELAVLWPQVGFIQVLLWFPLAFTVSCLWPEG